jgi:hypothetical protein
VDSAKMRSQDFPEEINPEGIQFPLNTDGATLREQKLLSSFR